MMIELNLWWEIKGSENLLVSWKYDFVWWAFLVFPGDLPVLVSSLHFKYISHQHMFAALGRIARRLYATKEKEEEAKVDDDDDDDSEEEEEEELQ
ncbi:hypothetical protein Bca4012_057931 [Brassica carinata]